MPIKAEIEEKELDSRTVLNTDIIDDTKPKKTDEPEEEHELRKASKLSISIINAFPISTFLDPIKFHNEFPSAAKHAVHR